MAVVREAIACNVKPKKPVKSVMKTPLLTTAITALSLTGALAQGYIYYSIRVTGSIVAHVYNYDPNWPSRQQYGDTATETPPGTQTYAGALLTGSGWSAQLWAANGTGQPEDSLTAVPSSVVSFRTGATLGGTIATRTLYVPQVLLLGSGTFQLRVWDNLGGSLVDWNVAEDAWLRGLIPAGKSLLFNCGPMTQPLNIQPNMDNFRSFNVYWIPEPGTPPLLALGGLVLWFLRRKQA